jgi:protein-tyrosine phosphatase
MAEFLLKKLARDRGWNLQARSAGTAADPSLPIPFGVRAALRAQGIADVEHEPQAVSRELLDWADLVLVMERRHRDFIVSRFPEMGAKVQPLKGPEDIADPIGLSDEAYAACCREINDSLQAMLSRRQPEEPTHASYAQEPRS